MTSTVDDRRRALAPDRTPMEDFHNRLRIMLSIDAYELHEAGVKMSGREWWDDFRHDPFRWFIRASEEDAAKVWAIMERRMWR
jgi:hypothetical protein